MMIVEAMVGMIFLDMLMRNVGTDF